MKSSNAPFNEFGQSMILRDIEDLYIDVANLGKADDAFASQLAIINSAIVTINSSISGLGTMSAQNANAVAITGGTISGVTLSSLTAALAVTDGGTGLATVAADKILYSSALNTLAPTAITSFGRTIIACVDAAAGRTQLGLGTIALQDASSVSITGGSITNITDILVADGGTGASTASGARTNLGLGTISTQNVNSVSITGGSITGITDLAVADGGTAASTASGARTNLGLGTVATQNANALDFSTSATLVFGVSGGTMAASSGALTFTGGSSTFAIVGAPLALSTTGGTDLTLSGSNSGTGGVVVGAASDKVGFYAASGQAKQTVTGSRAGNAALASLLDKLRLLGLITDSTT